MNNLLQQFRTQATQVVDDQPQVDLEMLEILIIQECGEVCRNLIKRGASADRLPQLLRIYFDEL